MRNYLIKLKTNILKSVNWFRFVKKNFSHKPPVYTKINEGIRIHLGSGEVNLQGWINIDGIKLAHIHNVDKDFNLHEFKDNSVSEIYLSHVLEHFSFKESKVLLENLKFKLKPSGIIRISVPDIDKILHVYEETKNLNLLKNAIMGGQNTDLDFHKSIYNFTELKNLLLSSGYKNVLKWNTTDDFGQSIGDWSDFTHKINGKKFNLNLNLKAST